MAGRDVNLIGPMHQGNNDGYQLVTLPQSLAAASGAIATISGIVKIRNIVGTVTTVLATSSSLRVFIGATAITASTTITTLTTLTLLLRETAIASVLTTIVTSIPSLHANPTDLIAGTAGSTVTITASLDASGTGVINWGLEYMPLSPGARITASQ